MNRPTILLAEDNVLLREGLVRVLDHLGFDVSATASTADELVNRSRVQRFDLIVTDVRMPPSHTDEGLKAASRLRQDQPDLPVVVLSQYVSAAYLDDLLSGDSRAGFGYLLKDRISDLAQFADALRRVLRGGTAVDPAVVTALLRQRREPLHQLTTRETEVLAKVAEGHSNLAIAEELFITEAAVVKHFGSVMSKLGLPPNASHNRRVLAVLTYLRSQQESST